MAERRPRAWQRWLVVVAVASVAPWVLALPAAADPVGPTHFDSSVTDVVDADGGVLPLDVEVVGGDAYVVLRAPADRTVEVAGYDAEPYLRFEPDGRVLVNTRSPARWLNEARYGALDVVVPAAADPQATPAWELASETGEYAWHDHRLHFMSPTLPPEVDRERREAQQVLTWTIPVSVDEQPGEVRGELTWRPGPPSAWPAVAGVVAVVSGVALGLVAGAALPPVLAGAALLTGGVGAVVAWSMPTGADVEPALIVLPGVALLVLLLARYAARHRAGAAPWLTAAAGAPVLVWGVVQLGALTRPIVPGPLPATAMRVVVVAALAAGLAAVTVALRRAGSRPSG